MTPITPLVTETTLGPRPQGSREELAAAAKQFEAIFVRQMLAAARKTSFGDDLLGSEAMGTFRQMQDDRFADIASERGAFGVAKMIETHLARVVAPEAPVEPKKD